MAILYQAELTPSKLELIEAWAPTQPWFEGETGLANLASFRFDDPEGEVGIETVLVRSGDGPLQQVVLSYRGAPLAGGDAWFIDTMQHSVLGKRWVYDGLGDPAYIAALATTILAGGHQADLIVDTDGARVSRAPTALVSGSGTDATTRVSPPAIESVRTRHEQGVAYIDTGDLRLAVSRVLPTSAPDQSVRGALSGTWDGQSEPLHIAWLF